MLVILNGVKDLALDCGSHKLTCVIGNHRWGPSLGLGMTASSRAIGSSTRQTFSARIFCPAALGWMPSGKFNEGSPATPCSRYGIRAVLFFVARSLNILPNADT